MESKICNRCGIEKRLNAYHKHPTSKNGVRGICKKCINEQRKVWYKNQTPFERQLRVMADGILSRTTGSTSRRQYFDRGIECRIGKNRVEVASYLREHFSEDIQAMLNNGDRPSIDRIDSNGHYEAGNIRIMEFGENAKKGSVNGGKTYQELYGHALLIKDLKTGETTKAPSKTVAAEIVGCSRGAIAYHLKHNSTPIYGIYKITRERDIS